jgi:hypothetical protein
VPPKYKIQADYRRSSKGNEYMYIYVSKKNSPRREVAAEVTRTKLKQSTNLRKLPNQRQRKRNKKLWYKAGSSWGKGISLSLTSNYVEFENAVTGGG